MSISPTDKRTERDWDLIDQKDQENKFVLIDDANPLFDFAQTVEQYALSNGALSEKEGDSKRLKADVEQPALQRIETLEEDIDWVLPDLEFDIDPNDPLFYEEFHSDLGPLFLDDIFCPDLFNTNSTDDLLFPNLADMTLDQLFEHAENPLADHDLYLKEIKERNPFLFESDKTGLEGIQEAKQAWEKEKAFWNSWAL